MLVNSNNKKSNFKIDENISYFIGVLHSDGCIYNFFDKKRNRKIVRLNLGIGEKSVPMALKFKKILFDYFDKTINLRRLPNKKAYSIQTSINRIKDIMNSWNEKIPLEIIGNSILFGSYLAGLIDGDGYVKLKNNIKDRIIPQCLIKIASDRPLIDVKESIINHIGCSVHFEYDKNSKGVYTCFYISRKNIDYIRNYIFPHIAISHKISALKKFFKMKSEPTRI